MATATGTCRPRLTSTDLQYAFCDVMKLQNARLPMVRSRRGQSVFLQIRVILEKGLGHLFIIPQVVLISSVKLILSSISLAVKNVQNVI